MGIKEDETMPYQSYETTQKLGKVTLGCSLPLFEKMRENFVV